MARKGLLKDLMGQAPPAPAAEASEPPAPRPDPAPRPERARYGGGAVGAVSRSIADLKSRSITDLDPFAIEEGGLRDRLEHDEADHAQLMASLKEYGQQVPVLVRPHPEVEGRYQIVYGRRRVLALRDLGLPVKAMIRDLDDRALVLAQGQENTARRDLSFIEKANFARQMVEAGYERKVIADALSIDKTVISRMLSVAERLPVALIEAVGSAPGIGRDRWVRFADLWEAADREVDEARAMLATAQGEGPDARFEALIAWLEGAQAREAARTAPAPRVVRDAAGVELARVTTGEAATTIRLSHRHGPGFAEWLGDNLDEIHRGWKQRGE